MAKMLHNNNASDNGTAFGTWTDHTSRFIYHDAMPTLLQGIAQQASVGDLGGGNGLLKEWLPNSIAVDWDEAKEPDIVASVFDYVGTHDVIVLRYVLHYLQDKEVLMLMRHLHTYHHGSVLVIQFTNADLATKYYNSHNETKYFRTTAQLKALLTEMWQVTSETSMEYVVGQDFYENRLGRGNAYTAHDETLVGITLRTRNKKVQDA